MLIYCPQELIWCVKKDAQRHAVIFANKPSFRPRAVKSPRMRPDRIHRPAVLYPSLIVPYPFKDPHFPVIYSARNTGDFDVPWLYLKSLSDVDVLS